MKYNSDSFIERYKARLIAQGFSQVYEINYTKTFAIGIRQYLLRIFLAIAVMLG